MDPIKPLDGLTALLRKRIADELAAKGGVRNTGVARDPSATSGTGRPPMEALRRRVERGIEAIDPDDPTRPRKAVRLFVEGVLAWQFGDAVLNDPRFAALVDDMQAALEKEPGVVAQILGAENKDR